MVKRIGGGRRKTRSIFRKKPCQRGKVSMSSYFQTLKEGDKVYLIAEPAIHNGMYFRRFNARPCIVIGKRGACYKVKLRDGGKDKILIVHPVHLKKSVSK
jgi:large subunit ribosomal protein L21e